MRAGFRLVCGARHRSRRFVGAPLEINIAGPREGGPLSIFTLHNYSIPRYRYPVVGITIAWKTDGAGEKETEGSVCGKERKREIERGVEGERNIYTLYHVYK